MDWFLNIVVGVVDYLQHIPAEYYQLAGVLIALSGAQQVFKVKFNNEARKLSDGANILITAALSGLVVAGDTFFSAAQANPQLLGVKEAAALGAMTLIYRVAVKPVSTYVENLMADAREFRQQQEAQRKAEVEQAAADSAALIEAPANPTGPGLG